MSWNPIDFQGLMNFDPKIIEHLENYLQEKESYLAHQILTAVPFPPVELTPPSSSQTRIKFSEAVEGFTKKVRLVVKEEDSNGRSDVLSRRVIKEINHALWEFTEILEGCAVELFQQIHGVPITRWQLNFVTVIQSLKESLILRIDDLIWVIRRMENPVKEFCQKFRSTKRSWLHSFFEKKPTLDSHLLDNLQQTEKFLNIQFEAFKKLFDELMFLTEEVQESLKTVKNYQVLKTLDVRNQTLYIDIFRLLKMLEINPQSKKEIAKELVVALKNLGEAGSIFHLFKSYLKELKAMLFKSSLEWKALNGGKESSGFIHLKNRFEHLDQERYQFVHTLSRYRAVILKTDSNPYVSSRWGFTEWIVGPEPADTKKLLDLLYSSEELTTDFSGFLEILSKDPSSYQNQQNSEEIERLLREIGQPLISLAMIRNRSERLLEELRKCDEIGNPQKEVISFVGNVLLKAMREDWKYHVLHEFPLFHRIYHIHQGLVNVFDDPAHIFRIERFRHYFLQIEDWIKKDNVSSHIHEIELDINDMKTYLQDFLASIQRLAKEKPSKSLDKISRKFYQQLLEYQYSFGQFFHNLVKKPDGQRMRYKFIFVDQYFESAENLLKGLTKNDADQTSL